MTDASQVKWNTARGTVGAAVPPGGTLELPYPSIAFAARPSTSNENRSQEVVIIGDSSRYTSEHFEFGYGDRTLNITNNSGEVWPAGASVLAQFPIPDEK